MEKNTCTKECLVDYCDGMKASVDVTSEHTMADVCRLMYETWDGHMLPDQDVEWAFSVVGSFCDTRYRMSEKQEHRKKAWNIISRDIRILEGVDKNCIKDCNKNKKWPAVIAP